MRILYAIQGTGNGHLSRARDIYPELCRYGTVDVLLSGIQVEVEVPFPVKYRMYGMSFIFGKNGGVNLFASILKLRLLQLWRDIRRLEVQQYDVVINDFEAISAWAAWWRKVPCIALSHHWASKHRASPKAKHPDWRGIFLLRWYAPCKKGYGFHFKAYAPEIFTPVIREEIRSIEPSNLGHITVYLPAYDTAALLPVLQLFPDTEWQVFSKHATENNIDRNVHTFPIDNARYIQSLATSAGALIGAGFEGPAEALFLKKKLMVVPMRDQYEQQCNAAALAAMGVPILRRVSTEQLQQIRDWLEGKTQTVRVDYPNQTAAIISKVLQDFQTKQSQLVA